MVGCSAEHIGSQIGAGRIIPEVNVSSEVMSVANPAQVTVLENVPAADSLSLRITSADGEYSGSWQTLSSYFPAEAILPGSYIVEAYYGSPLVEGFDSPYYYGSAACVHADGKEEVVNIDCSLSKNLLIADFS
ncbi:MAG: DUF4493 domain-containing protein, partial [Paramuribaculum sp.]|nr:DUF4493 domain-containing protein [Paramuribaculum sp.]